MSEYYGYLTGHRGTTTRCGSAKSGISSHIKSWKNDIYAILSRDDDGKDILSLKLPDGLRISLNNKFYIVKGEILIDDALKKDGI